MLSWITSAAVGKLARQYIAMAGDPRVSTPELHDHLKATREDLLAALSRRYREPLAKLLILKAVNLLLCHHHWRHRHAWLSSSPVTFLIDPANACQLCCPGCVHSDNEDFTRLIDWPPAVMPIGTYEALLRRRGPHALNTVLYNYGEPLLNKRIADFVRCSHSYGLSVHISTNFSLAFDVEGFVDSQPDHVIVSIDGATQEIYGRYRRRGDLALVLDNLERAAAARRRAGHRRPYLVWRFLTFEHNVHEIDAARDLAERVGVDQFIVETPFGVSHDDGAIVAVSSPRRGAHTFRPIERARADRRHIEAAISGREQAIDDAFERGWPAAPVQDPAAAGSPCAWLYFSASVDALGRVLPCCSAPAENKPLVFGHVGDRGEIDYNAELFTTSRRLRSLPAALRGDDAASSYCGVCAKDPPLTYSPSYAFRDLRILDHRRILSRHLKPLRSFGRA
jgi:MoaA/NifB/PqqE/SkfB family radical SAM enzyme